MTAYRKKILIVIALIILVLLIIKYIFFSWRSDESWQMDPESTDYYQSGEYTINPESIIALLDSGETNVFMPELATPQFDQPLNSIYWHESDYLKVVNALHDHIWGQSLGNWSAYEVLLSTECDKYSQGFETGRFTFFQTLWSNGSIYYNARSMTILPQRDLIEWGGGTTFPHPIFGWKGYDLNKLKISAEDALNIAEQQGGEKFRLTYSNQCGISISLGGVSWKVVYFHAPDGFVIDIDPYSGSFKVLKTSK